MQHLNIEEEKRQKVFKENEKQKENYELMEEAKSELVRKRELYILA